MGGKLGGKLGGSELGGGELGGDELGGDGLEEGRLGGDKMVSRQAGEEVGRSCLGEGEGEGRGQQGPLYTPTTTRRSKKFTKVYTQSGRNNLNKVESCREYLSCWSMQFGP